VDRAKIVRQRRPQKSLSAASVHWAQPGRIERSAISAISAISAALWEPSATSKVRAARGGGRDVSYATPCACRAR